MEKLTGWEIWEREGFQGTTLNLGGDKVMPCDYCGAQSGVANINGTASAFGGICTPDNSLLNREARLQESTHEWHGEVQIQICPGCAQKVLEMAQSWAQGD